MAGKLIKDYDLNLENPKHGDSHILLILYTALNLLYSTAKRQTQHIRRASNDCVDKVCHHFS